MASNFPTSLDSFTNPSATDAMDSVTVPHATQHADLNDAVESLQAKVGADSSAVTTSLDYKVANQGLTLVKSQTISSSLTHVDITNVFSSAFENYRILYTNFQTQSNTGVRFRLATASPDNSNNYYLAGSYNRYNGGGAFYNQSAIQEWYIGAGDTTMASTVFDVFCPNLAGYTTYHLTPSANGNTTSFVESYAGVMRTTTQYTGFRMFPYSGTIGGGTIRVYGYNNG